MKPLSLRTLVSSLIAGVVLVAGLGLAWQHPLAPLPVTLAGVAVMLLCLRFEHLWLLLLPTLLPVVDLAPWTGWITFEEFDILVLCAAAGAWLRHGWRGNANPARPSVVLPAITVLYLVLLALSLARGAQHAGGFNWGLFQGYDGPMNSLRLAKSFVLAALFVPLLPQVVAAPQQRGLRLLGWGLALGLASCALATVWERLAFTDLLNFSADYRTTALFWEMHVGGAALDGFLALTLPAAVWLMQRSRTPARFALAGLILALGLYAALTTFSRGLYLGLGVSILMLGWPLLGSVRAALRALLAALICAGLSYLVFRHGGYRTLLALLGCATLLMLNAQHARTTLARHWQPIARIAAALVLATLALTWLLDKGAYLAYAALWLLGFASWLIHQRRPSSQAACIALAASCVLPLATAGVANHWGDTPALVDAAVALGVVVALALWTSATRPAWLPTHWQHQAGALAGGVAVAALVAVFSGGAYMGDRLANNQRDLAGRVQHWQAGLSLLQTPADWLLGQGLGRFPATFFFGAPGLEYPGSYHLLSDAAGSYLALSGPRYQAGYGEVLRISQRIAPSPAGRYVLALEVRSAAPAKLLVDVCTKHLLYFANCAGKAIAIPATGAQWKPLQVDWTQTFGADSPWYAHQLRVFSIALETTGTRVDVRQLQLTGPDQRPLLANGHFTDNLARWFFTSDRHHLPWHIKNMYLHVLFEQGALGLGALLLLMGLALWRSIRPLRGEPHALAPALAAGIVGFAVVGLFDSLLDVPRVAFLFYLMLLLAVALPTSKTNTRWIAGRGPQ